MGVLRTRALTREDAAAVWSRLDERGDVPLAVSWPWTETWLDHYGDTVEPELLAFERDAEPIAVALLSHATVKRRGVPVREVHVGTAGEPAAETVFVERNALHAAPGDREAVAGALVAHLRERRGWDVLALDGFAEADAQALAAAHGSIALEPQAAPYADLAAIRENGGDVVTALRKGPRQRVRRTLKEFGELELEWAETAPDARAIVDELARLHQRRWTAEGEAGAFASDRFTGFHRALLRRLAPGREAIAVRVRTRAKSTVGCLLCYADGDRVLFYQSGFATFENSKLRAGIATHALAMQAALDRGFGAYDFLAGEGRYKEELSTAEDALYWGTGRADGVRGRVLAGALALRRLV